jgi:demethylmenaquinone methyltransferase/2-methoxy-6-polyprenyl-1,4-benzoquinol methylase
MAKSFALTLLVLAVPVIALIIQRSLFAGVDAPPADFGTGSMFDIIATRYDLINRVLAVGMDGHWRQTMVQKIKESVETLQEPKLLDVATGTADVALQLAKQIPSAFVVGVDPSQNMLDIGRTKVQKRGMSDKIDLQWADARELTDLADASFDAATMAFGIRNVPDRDRALCQIHRVLKPHSRFCILEFSEPDDSFGILGAGARMFIRYVVPFVGGILSGAPREYWHLQNSIKDFPAPQQFGEQLENLDCDHSSSAFRLDELIQLNFGSVQLYVLTVLRSEPSSSDEQ